MNVVSEYPSSLSALLSPADSFTMDYISLVRVFFGFASGIQTVYIWLRLAAHWLLFFSRYPFEDPRIMQLL